MPYKSSKTQVEEILQKWNDLYNISARYVEQHKCDRRILRQQQIRFGDHMERIEEIKQAFIIYHHLFNMYRYAVTIIPWETMRLLVQYMNCYICRTKEYA
jgi:hypothetical protein